MAIKTVISAEDKKRLQEKSAMLLNCFGFVNAKPEDIEIIDFYSFHYLLINFENIKIQFNYNSDGETRSWNLKYCEE